MLDAISGGRLDVGIARAFLPHEFRRFGRSPDESVARYREGIEQVDLLLADSTMPADLGDDPNPDANATAALFAALYEGLGLPTPAPVAPAGPFQRGVTPPGWREAAGAYGDEGSFRSVADVVDGASLARVREFKQAAKAQAPSSTLRTSRLPDQAHRAHRHAGSRATA